MLGNFVGIEELEGAARTLDEEFHRLTETEVGNAIGGHLQIIKSSCKFYRWQWLILPFAILTPRLPRGWASGYTRLLDSGCDKYVCGKIRYILEIIIYMCSRYRMTELRMMRAVISSATRKHRTHTRELGELGRASRCFKSQSICTTATSNATNIRQLEEAKLLIHNAPKTSTKCNFSTTLGTPFLQPSKRGKGLSAQSNAVLDPDYLDAMVRYLC